MVQRSSLNQFENIIILTILLVFTIGEKKTLKQEIALEIVTIAKGILGICFYHTCVPELA